MSLIIETSGTHEIRVNMQWPDQNRTFQFCKIRGWIAGRRDLFEVDFSNPDIYENKISIDLLENEIGLQLTFALYVFDKADPPEVFDVQLFKQYEDIKLYEWHPTIDWQRYLPDWTFEEYIENLSLFNLRFIIDDVSRELRVEFNESDYLNKQQSVKIPYQKDLSSFDNIMFDQVSISYSDEAQQKILIDRDGVSSDQTKKEKAIDELVVDFKVPDTFRGQVDIRDSFLDQDGQGMAIYDTARAPVARTSLNNLTLDLNGATGIYRQFHNRWINMLLNASPLKIEIMLTATLLSEILKKQDITINNQRFLIVDSEYEPTSSFKYRLELSVLKVSF